MGQEPVVVQRSGASLRRRPEVEGDEEAMRAIIRTIALVAHQSMEVAIQSFDHTWEVRYYCEVGAAYRMLEHQLTPQEAWQRTVTSVRSRLNWWIDDLPLEVVMRWGLALNAPFVP